MLAADLERIAESLAGQQRGRGALALDQGVGDQGRTVDDLPEAAHGSISGRQCLVQPGLDGARRVVRRGQRLPDDELPGRVVIDDQIVAVAAESIPAAAIDDRGS